MLLATRDDDHVTWTMWGRSKVITPSPLERPTMLPVDRVAFDDSDTQNTPNRYDDRRRVDSIIDQRQRRLPPVAAAAPTLSSEPDLFVITWRELQPWQDRRIVLDLVRRTLGSIYLNLSLHVQFPR